MNERETLRMRVDATALAERAASGDVKAFTSLYDLFYARIYNYARYRCDDDNVADDLTSQIFERLLMKIPGYSVEKGNFEAWLFALARNVVIDYHRAQKLRTFLPWETVQQVPDERPSPEEHSIHKEFEAELLTSLSHLSERERDFLGLKYAWGLKNNEIAELTATREGNVAIILHRALGRLRTLLENDSPTQPCRLRQEA
jgi:RNA polymerase sigma-70 factor (ECF subfamily)